jgi:hypothetical protein
VNSVADDAPVEIFTLGGVRVGTFRSFGDVRLDKGVYIFRQGGKSGKVSF